MSGEKSHKSFIRNALELGLWPLGLTRKAGQVALTAAEEIYAGRPLGDEPHITERLRPEVVVNEARIGKQFVDIAAMTDPRMAESSQEERELNEKRDGYNVYGHSKIVRALLDTEADPLVDHDQAQQVIDIAKAAGTDPMRLDSMFSELEQEQAKRIIEP